jgi:hypothetical protein
MKGRPSQGFIHLGGQVRFLLHAAKEPMPLHGDGCIIENIHCFRRGLRELSLPVTIAASFALDDLVTRYETYPKEQQLSADEAEKLLDLMRKVEHTLLAETATQIAYIVSPKRMEVGRLISDIAQLMGEGVYLKLPSIAQFDLAEAGKCIAFERSTAACFHLLRATESVLRNFYCGLVKRKRLKPLLWGPIVDQLRRKRLPPPIELLNHLDHIRVNFRNPTQHPDLIYSLDEAQNLFGLCIDVIERMVGSNTWQTPEVDKIGTDPWGT